MSKTAERKALILQSAQDLLAESGGAALSMRKVADRAGISLGNLQYHFATRGDLLAGMLPAFVERYASDLQALDFTRSGDLQADLAGLLRLVLNAPEIAAGGRVFKELWAEAQHSPDLAAAMKVYYADLAEFYAALLRSLDVPAVTDTQIRRAVSLLLPLLEGHCITNPMLEPDTDELARTWAHALAACLAERRD